MIVSVNYTCIDGILSPTCTLMLLDFGAKIMYFLSHSPHKMMYSPAFVILVNGSQSVKVFDGTRCYNNTFTTFLKDLCGNVCCLPCGKDETYHNHCLPWEYIKKSSLGFVFTVVDEVKRSCF
ncbi:hypothetical protein OTU49_001163 [Cherax quadricarinatus]|uniref:Uncharacterized protein n=1 Tax=Cherax quadricarinatus TaxID=27406 RepID=A0AAW0XVA8_CHEQU